MRPRAGHVGYGTFGRYRDCSGSLGALLCGAARGPDSRSTRNRPKTHPGDTARRAARRLLEFVRLWSGRLISSGPSGGRVCGQKTRPDRPAVGARDAVGSGCVAKTPHARARGGRRTRTRSDVSARSAGPVSARSAGPVSAGQSERGIVVP